MAKLTRSNIAYDLAISPHKESIEYLDTVITYVFSSDLYKTKFCAALQDNREKINNSLSNRFGFVIKNDMLCDLKLYLTVEKRGFLLYKGEQKIECQDRITLDGSRMIIEKSGEQ